MFLELELIKPPEPLFADFYVQATFHALMAQAAHGLGGGWYLPREFKVITGRPIAIEPETWAAILTKHDGEPCGAVLFMHPHIYGKMPAQFTEADVDNWGRYILTRSAPIDLAEDVLHPDLATPRAITRGDWLRRLAVHETCHLNRDVRHEYEKTGQHHGPVWVEACAEAFRICRITTEDCERRARTIGLCPPLAAL